MLIMAHEQTDRKSVWRSLDEAFMRHANKKNAAALVSAFYAADAKLLPPNAPMIRGTEAIRAFRQGLLDAGGADVTLDTTLVDMAGELAYGVGQYSFTLPAASGERTHERGTYLVVYRRQAGGSWKVVADMFSRRPAGTLSRASPRPTHRDIGILESEAAAGPRLTRLGGRFAYPGREGLIGTRTDLDGGRWPGQLTGAAARRYW